ncbi:MAG: (d)CMP kinase [Saprospiraceae bacterium]
MKNIIVAIDGYSSCGKSTIAKGLAQKLDYIFIDTGAMYRATTLYFLDNGVDFNDSKAVETALNNISIHFEKKGDQIITFLNGQNVENDIRTMRVSQSVSPVATISAVRRAMVREQQAMGKLKNVVLDGRDIGTVVFPDAELKLFITADPDIRAQRRVLELKKKGQKVDFKAVKTNLLERDHIDSSRADSPLRQADDATVIDTTHLQLEEQLEMVYELALEKIER